MKLRGVRGRFVREEDGFTLPEMLVTMIVMLVVLFALYSIFDMSVRVFRLGSDKVEAVENARLGLEKMERDIRAAYPVNRGDPDKRYLFFKADGSPGDPPEAMPSATQITFGNDLGGTPGKIECGNPCEYITYKLDGTNLRRVNAANSAAAGDVVVEFVKPDGLRFSYLKRDGTPAATQKEIATVRIELEISKDGRDQTLTTDVGLRNR